MHTPQHLINPVLWILQVLLCCLTWVLDIKQSAIGSLIANPCLQPLAPTLITILLPQSLKHRDYRIRATISSLLLHTLLSPKLGLNHVLTCLKISLWTDSLNTQMYTSPASSSQVYPIHIQPAYVQKHLRFSLVTLSTRFGFRCSIWLNFFFF